MAMIVQLILMIRRVCVVDDVIVVLIAGEGSSTIADDVRTGGGEHKTMVLLSSYPHRHRHRNNQPRTISTRARKVRMRYRLSPTIQTII